jgi:HEAT repeat protein
MRADASSSDVDEDLTPSQLFERFRRGDREQSLEALRAFRAIDNKQRFLGPALEFFRTEEKDQVRSWGAGVLEGIGGRRAFECLLGVLTPSEPEELKHQYRYTRFFALAGVARLERTEDERAQVTSLLEQLWVDRWQETTEDYLVQAEAAVLLSLRRNQNALAQTRAMLRSSNRDFWITWACLRALREFPLPEVAPEVVEVMRTARYYDHRMYALRALACYRDNANVVNELANVVRTSPDGSMRLLAVNALGELRNREAQDVLVRALADQDAEIRVRAAAALLELLTTEEAVSTVVQRALAEDTSAETLDHLLDALRRIDSTLSAEVLNRELGSQDRRRAQAAEEILINLGGWAAVQRLGQRRSTLDSLDAILRESEEVVRTTFADTIRQARLNFYFAMAVNVVVVIVGIALIVIAIIELAKDPSQLADWIVPGTAGVIGILINLFFNNPRRNAREDLTSLMNVNVIFLGFLRQLNEIDATFKHAYLESHTFGAEHMRVTVKQIERTVEQTLTMAACHLRNLPAGGRPQHIGAEETEQRQAELAIHSAVGSVATLGHGTDSHDPATGARS